MAEDVQIKKFGHACVRVDINGKVFVIDSGIFTEPESIEGADVLFFTHGHPDHIAPERVAIAREANPSLEVWASAGAAALDGVDGAKILTPGSTVEVGGVDITVSGGSHADVYPGMDLGDNVALNIAGKVFHPGDAFEMPAGDVDVVLAPIMAPWSRIADVVDYVKALPTGKVVPIHEGLLNATGIALFDRNVSGLSGIGDKYVRLDNGQSLSL